MNDAPRIEEKTVEFAKEETLFSMSISIEDIDKTESVKAEDITVTEKPEWMSYEFREGKLHLTGKPLEGVADEVVTESVVIVVEDERSGRSVERFDIVVRGINDEPEFVEIADKVIIVEEGSGELSVKVRDEETELRELVLEVSSQKGYIESPTYRAVSYTHLTLPTILLV